LGKDARSYDDLCIYRTYQQKLLGKTGLENQYIASYQKPFNKTTYENYFKFLQQKSIELHMDTYTLVSLLREKKIRNFTHHSDINDFFLDSVENSNYKFSDLISKHQIGDVLEKAQYDGLQMIFEIYYSEQINHAKQMEEQRTNNMDF